MSFRQAYFAMGQTEKFASIILGAMAKDLRERGHILLAEPKNKACRPTLVTEEEEKMIFSRLKTAAERGAVMMGIFTTDARHW